MFPTLLLKNSLFSYLQIWKTNEKLKLQNMLVSFSSFILMVIAYLQEWEYSQTVLAELVVWNAVVTEYSGATREVYLGD